MREQFLAYIDKKRKIYDATRSERIKILGFDEYEVRTAD